MTLYDWVMLGLSILAALVLPALGLVWRLAYKIHSNDLEHIAETEKTISASVVRIEQKLDDHIQAHAEGRFVR